MSPNDPIVDLFVIGAMKAATTGLCDWLAVQPSVAVSDPKEPSVFSSDGSVDSWQGRTGTLWPAAEPGTIRIEGSTDYAKHPAVAGVPERIATHHPDARFVYLMRHPVERAISQYRFEWILQADDRSFAEALRQKPQLVDNGRYAFQLARWLEVFPPERFLLLFAEAFADNPQAQVRRVLRHLDLPDDDVREPRAERSNETAQLVRPSLARRLFRDSALGQAARPLLPEAVARRYHRRLQARSVPDVGEAERRAVENAFDDDLRALSTLTGGPTVTCATWNSVTTTWTPQLTTS